MILSSTSAFYFGFFKKNSGQIIATPNTSTKIAYNRTYRSLRKNDCDSDDKTIVHVKLEQLNKLSNRIRQRRQQRRR